MLSANRPLPGRSHAVKVVRGRLGRQVDITQSPGRALIIDQTPALPTYSASCRSPRCRCRTRPACGDGVECPQQLAGAHIEAADIARRRFLVARAAGYHLHDDHVAHHEGRGHRADVRHGRAFDDAVAQVDPAVLAEVRRGLAGLRVDGDQAAVQRVVEQPLVLAVASSRRANAGASDAPRPPCSAGCGSKVQIVLPVPASIAAMPWFSHGT